MKLPDFTRDPNLIALKRKMGLDADAMGPFPPQLPNGGIDVQINEIVPHKDGTLTYKNLRVIVYIRDVKTYGQNFNEPRFHVAECTTLGWMKTHQKFEFKYVVTTREDGNFLINHIRNHGHTSKWTKLRVCQNCLDRLAFDKFSHNLSKSQKRAIVTQFTIPRFFEKYPRSLLSEHPAYDAETAPINNYTSYWDKISARIRSKRGWKCARCSRDLSAPHNQKHLHVHHINGLKYDNRDENLKVLCIGCHAEQPQHAHLKSTPDYQEFIRRFGPSA